jgi:hypothetical protein
VTGVVWETSEASPRGVLASVARSGSADNWECFERRLMLKTRLDGDVEGESAAEPPPTLLLNLSTTLDNRLTGEGRSFCVLSDEREAGSTFAWGEGGS